MAASAVGEGGCSASTRSARSVGTPSRSIDDDRPSRCNLRSAVRSPGPGTVLGREVVRVLADDDPTDDARLAEPFAPTVLAAEPLGVDVRTDAPLVVPAFGLDVFELAALALDVLALAALALAVLALAVLALAVLAIDVLALGVLAPLPLRAGFFCFEAVWAAFDRLVLSARCFACEVELGIVYSVGRVVVGVGEVVVGAAAGSMGASVGGGGT